MFILQWIQCNVIASGGLGGEVFIWDIEAALAPVSKSNDADVEDCSTSSNGLGSLSNTSLRPISSSNNISVHASQSQGYAPIAAKGHKESVYALATNDQGTLLVSGGTEKVCSCCLAGFLIDLFFLVYLMLKDLLRILLQFFVFAFSYFLPFISLCFPIHCSILATFVNCSNVQDETFVGYPCLGP